ncbi:MAG TPA: TIGR02300 family protein [Reyranella sp.]|nr:TIGR02300 family protein [Reyranella sp.]
MVKASWGTKRTCQNCAARFYDLNKSPIKCPKCGREHDREDFVKVRRGRASAATAAAATAAAAAAAAKLAAAKNKKVEEAALGEDGGDTEADDEALEDTEDLGDETEDIEVDVEDDDKGEGDR